jgi:hypothetical protein
MIDAKAGIPADNSISERYEAMWIDKLDNAIILADYARLGFRHFWR